MFDVSVIVPVYKVEAYLTRCIESILAQTNKNIQIILVDDGSPDQSSELCDCFAEQHNNIEVIHKMNGGLASARNAGMKIASGRYIYFVDSDDWIDENAVSELMSLGDLYDVDFVRYRAMYANWPNHKDGEVCEFGIESNMEEGLYNRRRIEKEIVPNMFATQELKFGPILSAWASLFKRSFLIDNDLCFYEDVKYSEDANFSANVIWKANSFYYLNGPRYYHYFFNPKSISKAYQNDLWDNNKRIIAHFKKDYAAVEVYDFSQQIYRKEMFCVLDALSNLKKANSYRERTKGIKEICEDPITREACRNVKAIVSWKLRVVLWLIRLKFAFALAMI